MPSVKHFDPALYVVVTVKRIVKVTMLPGGITVTLYEDGSSKTEYPSGKFVDRAAMPK